MDSLSFDKYRLSEDAESTLWKNCHFVFDSSALLEFYNFSDENRTVIYNEIFEKEEVKGKLWVPAHVQFEYFKNRNSKIKKPINEKYSPLETTLETIQNYVSETKNQVKELKDKTKNPNRHPYIEQSDFQTFESAIEQYDNCIKEFSKNIKEKIREKQIQITKLEQKDDIQENFLKYFKVGEEYSFEKLIEISVEGKHRYEFDIPPGYKDFTSKEKKGLQIFGDLIIWKQILDFSAKEKVNVILVSNDLKEDWWGIEKTDKEKAKAPREELIREFSDKTSQSFWMYSLDQFVYSAKKFLGSNIDEVQLEQIQKMTSIKQRMTPKLEILDARYFTERSNINVTAALNALIKDNVLLTIANNNIVGDPDVGVAKKLRINYGYGSLVSEIEYNEGDPVKLPKDEQELGDDSNPSSYPNTSNEELTNVPPPPDA